VTLPADLRDHALAPDDVDDIVAMVNACELHDSGEVMLERADLLSDLAVEAFDVERDLVGVSAGSSLVGWAMIESGRRVRVDVHPDVRGLAVGTWLRRWTERRARELGRTSLGQTIDDARTDAVGLLRRAGYRPSHTSWILRIDHDARPPDPRIPAGVRLRTFEPGEEDEVLAMFERAFAEWDGRAPTPLGTWRTMVTRRDGFRTDDLVVAEVDGAIVGGAFMIDSGEIWVDKLAVAREHRHHGIARALLQTAFRRSFDRGYGRTSLSTDSRTGALSLYERLGMTVERSFTHLAIDL
jgi:GNAT superfamily N-acetyltransferase